MGCQRCVVSRKILVSVAKDPDTNRGCFAKETYILKELTKCCHPRITIARTRTNIGWEFIPASIHKYRQSKHASSSSFSKQHRCVRVCVSCEYEFLYAFFCVRIHRMYYSVHICVRKYIIRNIRIVCGSDYHNDFLYSQKSHKRKNALKRKTHIHIHTYNYDQQKIRGSLTLPIWAPEGPSSLLPSD